MRAGGVGRWEMDNYQLGKRIGRGNYGTVYVARDKRNNRWYCLKTIMMEAHSEEEREKAQQEVEVLRGLDHPGIVRYHEHFVHEDSLCVVMHYCEGGDLAQAIKQRAKAEQPFNEQEVISLFVQIVMALHYVHSKRILHRDLKTQNIFITKARDGQMGLVKLGDFGIAKVLEGSYAAASTVIGTPYYMSPEVCQGQPYGYMSDVWALGCILYEISALQQAWNGSNLLGLVYKIVQERQPPLPEHYSEDLKELVGRMLSKEPGQRPSLSHILKLPFIRTRMQPDTLKLFDVMPSIPPAEAAPKANGAASAAATAAAAPPAVAPPTAAPLSLSGGSRLSSSPHAPQGAIPHSAALRSQPPPPMVGMAPATPSAASKPSMLRKPSTPIREAAAAAPSRR